MLELKVRHKSNIADNVQNKRKIVTKVVAQFLQLVAPSLLLQERRDTTQDTCPHPMKG